MLVETLQPLIEQGMRQGHHLGAQIYISQHRQVLMDHAFGQAEPGNTLSCDHLTVWFSAGKPLTAVAMMQQIEAGHVHLDDPVVRFMPAFAAHGKDAITLRHLLTHTAGLRLAPFRFPEDDWSTIIDKISQARPEPRWPPGQKAGYHLHTSWFILAELVSRISGTDYSSYLREEVLDPLGMHQSHVGMAPDLYDRLSPWLASMPNTNAQDPDRGPTPYHTGPWIVPPRPGGNAVGPVRDLGVFYEALLHGGGNEHGHVLKAQTVACMRQRHREAMLDQTFKHVMDWGLGLILNHPAGSDPQMPYGFGSHASPEAFGHGGSQSSLGMADPEHGLVIAVVFLGMPGEAAHRMRINALLDQIYTLTTGCRTLQSSGRE